MSAKQNSRLKDIRQWIYDNIISKIPGGSFIARMISKLWSKNKTDTQNNKNELVLNQHSEPNISSSEDFQIPKAHKDKINETAKHDDDLLTQLLTKDGVYFKNPLRGVLSPGGNPPDISEDSIETYRNYIKDVLINKKVLINNDSPCKSNTFNISEVKSIPGEAESPNQRENMNTSKSSNERPEYGVVQQFRTRGEASGPSNNSP